MPKKRTFEDFILTANNIHNNKYDYSKSFYKNSYTKVCIICPKHREFYQRPKDHLQGQGCPRCANKKNGLNGKYTNNEFAVKSNIIHNNKYDYSKVDYVNTKTKVCIICPEHGTFKITPQNHLRGQGCPECSNKQKGSYKKLNTEIFITKAKEIHGDKYNYSKVHYINNQTKVYIICQKHGEFWQKPNDHLNGHGCPECGRNFSVSENKVLECLKKKYKNVIHQYRPKWLFKKTSPQSLDIFLLEYNIGIEYHGIQHFYPNTKFGGQEQFILNQERDIRKYNKCIENNVKIFYISFEKNIPDNYFATIYKTIDDLIKAIDAYIITKNIKK